MSQLPEAYLDYLMRNPGYAETVRPVLLQSAADPLCGVRVVIHPHEHQAHLDERIPYGEIVEDVD